MQYTGGLSLFAGSKVKAGLLEIIAAFPGKKWTGRALARETGFSQPQACRALHELETQDVVICERIGKAEIWKFNDRHLFAEHLKALASPKKYLCKRLLEEIRKANGLSHIVRIVLFGSIARGDGRPDSDIDIFVEIDDGRKSNMILQSLLDVSVHLLPSVGTSITPIIHSTTDVLSKRNAELQREIEKDGFTIYHR